MGVELFPDNIRESYEIHEWRHAAAILKGDFPNEWHDIMSVLSQFQLKESQITIGGGRKSNVAGSLDSHFADLSWVEKGFEIQTKVDNQLIESKTHKLDCYKNKVGLEIEWNNKDTFFDRDLDKFRLLFDLQAISVGVIITRCTELQYEIFKPLGIGDKYSTSTTHLGKLLPKLHGGGGGGCPILVFGISSKLYQPDITGRVPDAIPKGTRRRIIKKEAGI